MRLPLVLACVLGFGLAVGLVAGKQHPKPAVAKTLVLSKQAQRYLVLQYREFSTEFMGCMIGEVRGSTVVVERIAPADVDSAASRATRVVPKGSCEDAGWTGVVGIIHSHPGGERCFYYFPTTIVPSSDGASFAMNDYPVDAIMCGTKVVWIARDAKEHELELKGLHLFVSR